MNKVFQSNLKISVAVASLTLIILSFQNCSKYQYSATDVSGANNASGTLNTETLPDGSYEVNDGSVVPVDPVVADPVSAPVMAGSSSGAQPTSGDSTSSGSSISSSDSTTSTSQPARPTVIGSPIVDDDSPAVYDDDDDDDDSDSSDDQCKREIRSHRNLCAAYPEGRIYHGGQGLTIIVPSNVDQLPINPNGKLVLCGVTVDKVVKRKGALVLVDSVVHEIINDNGNIKIFEYGQSSSNIGSGVTIKKYRGED